MARPSYGFTTANTPTTPATATLMMREPLGTGQMWLAYWHACENNSGAVAMRTGLQRCTGAGTGTIAAGEKLDTRAPAVATYTEFTRSFTANPTFTGNYVVLFYGGVARYIQARWSPPRPWATIVLVNGEEIAQKGNAQNGNIPNACWSLGTPGGGPRRLARRSRDAGIWHQGEARGYLIGAATQIRGCQMNYVVQRATRVVGVPRSTVLLFGPSGTNATQTLTAALASAAAIVKQPIKVLSAALATAAVIVKAPAHTISAASTTAAAIVKKPLKALSAALATTATVAEARIKAQTLSAALTTAAAIVKQPGKVLSASLATAASITKAPGRVLSAALTTAAVVVKQPQKIIAAVSTTTAVVAETKVKLQTLAASVTSAASIVKQPAKVFAAASSTGAAIVKTAGHVISAASVTLATLAKQPGRALSAAVASAAALVKQPGKTVTTVVTTGASVVESTTTTSGTLITRLYWSCEATDITPPWPATLVVGGADAPTLTSQYAFRGGQSCAFHLAPGTTSSEVVGFSSSASIRCFEGDEKWFSWATRVGESVPTSGGLQVLMQIAQSTLAGSAPIALIIDAAGSGAIQFASGPCTALDPAFTTADTTPTGLTLTQVQGRWFHWLVRVKFSATPSIAFVNAWANGNLVVDTWRPSHGTLFDTYSYPKLGYARDPAISVDATVWHDEYRYGSDMRMVVPAWNSFAGGTGGTGEPLITP